MSKLGRFSAKFVGIEFGTSSNGNEQIVIDLDVEGDVYSTILSFSDKARPYSEERLVALGWKGKGHPLDKTGLTNEVQVELKEEQYKDQTSGEMKTVTRCQILTNGGRIVMKDVMNSVQRANFLERLTGVKVARGAAKAPPPKAAAAPPPEPEAEDDLPF